MKLMKSLLLGSAAGLCAVAGAQAADLPVKKAAPVQYVRVCTAFGAGFFYIPGTDTCLRVGGRARGDVQYTSNRTRNSDVTGFRGELRLELDARDQTAYGTLRAFVRLTVANRTGAFETSGTQVRYSNAFYGGGVDQYQRSEKFVEVDKAFIQFAGFTIGRAASFYDFYAGDAELIQSGIYSINGSSINLLAYTATFGDGFSATVSLEDPVFRRAPTFGTVASIGGAGAPTTNSLTPQGTLASASSYFGQGVFTPVGTSFAANGVPTSALNLATAQTNYTPDFIGALRYDASWGAAQLSAASHELRTGTYNGAVFGTPTTGGAAPAVLPGLGAAPRIPDSTYGFAVQGGLKLNLPQIAPGDTLWLQAAYANGANNYTGVTDELGSGSIGQTTTNRFAGANGFGTYDYAVDTAGRTHLTTTWSGSITYLHFWTPEYRSAFFGSYGRAEFDNALRGPNSPLIGQFFNAAGANNPVVLANTGTGLGRFSGFAKDWQSIYAGANLIWSPVKNLDIGVEALYARQEFLGGGTSGRTYDSNKNNGRTATTDDAFITRLRVQRDF